MRASDHVALATPGIKRIAILLQVLDLSETMSGADFSQLRVLPDNVQRKILRLAQEGNETAIGPGTTGNLEVDSVSRADEKDGLEKLLREGYVVLDKVLGFSEGYLKVSGNGVLGAVWKALLVECVLLYYVLALQ